MTDFSTAAVDASIAQRKSSVIFQNQHYTACAMRDGSLIVSHNRKHGGKRIVGPDAEKWTFAIQTAIDRDEANALCCAILN